MNDTSHYDAVWDATYDLVFDGTSVVNSAATGNISVVSITITNAFSGTWSISGFTLSCSAGFSDDGITGTHTYGTSITCSGNSSTFHCNPGGTLSSSSCTIIMNGTTAMVLDIDKLNNVFKALTLGTNAIVTVSGAATNSFSGTGPCLTMGNNSTLTANVGMGFNVQNSSAIISIGTGCTINGSGIFGLRIGATGITATLPAFTYTGTGTIHLGRTSAAYTGSTLQLTGNLTTTAGIDAYVDINAAAITVDFNGFNISCTAFRSGSSAPAGTASFTVLFGEGSHTFTSFTGATYNTAGNTMTENFETCSISCGGSWTFGSNHIITTGICIVTITTTSTITSNSKSFYDLIINSGANTVTMADALVCATGGDLTLTAGTMTTATFNLTVGANVAVNGTSTLTISGTTASFGGNYTTAATATVTINAATNYTFTGTPTVTTNGITLPQCTFNGNFAINGSCTITRLIWGTDGITGTFGAGNTFVLSNLTAANWNGSAGLYNALRSSTPGTQWTFTLPNTVTLQYMNPQDSVLAGFQITVNDGTSVNSGNNVNWIWPISGVGQRARSTSKIAISAGI